MDLIGDTTIRFVTNLDRCLAALTVCEITGNASAAVEPLHMLGLIQTGLHGLEPTSNHEGLPWTQELYARRR